MSDGEYVMGKRAVSSERMTYVDSVSGFFQRAFALKTRIPADISRMSTDTLARYGRRDTATFGDGSIPSKKLSWDKTATYILFFMNESTVILSTPKILAISHFETFLSSSTRIVSSFPLNLTFRDFAPTGLPRTTPSAFFRARASFVL